MTTAVDVSDLIDQLKSSVNPPGTNLFPDALESDWVNNLRNGFWEATLDGVIIGYTEDEGAITPITPGTVDFPKDLQQLTILYAGVTIIRNYIMNMKSVFRTVAGPVEYEVQFSAQVLKSILDELVRKRSIILQRLSDLNHTNSFYFDAAIARDLSILYRDTHWIGF